VLALGRSQRRYWGSGPSLKIEKKIKHKYTQDQEATRTLKCINVLNIRGRGKGGEGREGVG